MARDSNNYPEGTKEAIEAFFMALGKDNRFKTEKHIMQAGDVYFGTAGDVADGFVALKLATQAHLKMQEKDSSVYRETLARIKDRVLTGLRSTNNYEAAQMDAAFNALMKKAGCPVTYIQSEELRMNATPECYYPNTLKAAGEFVKSVDRTTQYKEPAAGETLGGLVRAAADAFTGLVHLEASNERNGTIKKATIGRIKDRLFRGQTLDDAAKLQWETAFNMLKQGAGVNAALLMQGNNHGDIGRGKTN